MKTLALLLTTTSLFAQQTYKVAASPKTVVIGAYTAGVAPAIKIKSGDTVEIQTVTPSCRAAAATYGVQPELKEINEQVKERGPGGHILTGPIYVEGAEPGNVLEVRIKKITLDVPYACNSFAPGRGFLPDDFPYAKSKVIPLDREKMIGQFAPGVNLPLHPFFGSMGVAGSNGPARLNSTAPWYHAGNMDNKELVAGSTLYIPVHATGAMFEVGDGHAGQGDGEVDITAMETSLTGTFEFIVHKDFSLKWPRAETPTHYITMGFHEDLKEAATLATRDMILFLRQAKHLSEDDAYMLTSVAADLHISQLVDTKSGVHAMIAKSIFTQP